MRRRISLYINGQLADLADDGLVLLNVQLSDLTNPAVVRNSWTQEVELPRCPANDRIFGHSGRLDRLAGAGGTGPDFNASKRTPFAIYAETGEVLFSGYAKLNGVTRDAYRVSLYGGIGDFLYGLAYDGAGNKRSLADLDYGVDLDFTINLQTVRDAWARLAGDTSKPEKWDVINFAPCYNGVPSDFSADKAVADPGDVGLTVPAGYNTKSGLTLITLSGEKDEWEVRDLRSYLQRPVVSMAKILEAIANPLNNGGWDVDLSDVTIGYQNTWLTRPLLPSLGTYKKTSGGATVTFQQYAAGKVVGRFSLSNVPAGSDVTARLTTALAYTVPGAPAATLRSWKRIQGQSYIPDGYIQQILFVQAVAYGSDNSMVAAGPVKTICKSADVIDPSALASALGYTPLMSASFAAAEQDHGYAPSSGAYLRQRDITTEVTGQNIACIDIQVTAYVAHISDAGALFGSGTGGSSSLGQLYTDAGTGYTPTAASAPSGSGTSSYESGDSLRSGATVTKEMLLSTSKTPADYLVAFCKAFGLVLLADRQKRSVRILRRETFYQATTVDITDRVDKPSVDIQPMTFDAKWYELRHESVGGRFEQEYLRTSGVQYGIQRIDTGYDFDAQTKDLLSGSVLKSCAAVQARSKYWYRYVWPLVETRQVVGTGATPIHDSSLFTLSAKEGQHVILTISGHVSAAPAGYNSIIVQWGTASHLVISNPIYLLGNESGDGTYDLVVPYQAKYLQLAYFRQQNGETAVFTLSQPQEIPSLLVDSGCTYALWNADGASEDFGVVIPGEATADPLNADYPGYDTAERAEFRDAENAPVDGADVLLYFISAPSQIFYQLSDDLPAMDTLNGGPCWILGASDSPQVLPHFSRYFILEPLGGTSRDVHQSLDFGIPREVDIPGLTYTAGTIYQRRWRRYVQDRLSVHGKVMRCRVRLDGMQVGPELLRRFYWYGGSLWSLVSVSNHSLTTFDLTECEFVQVLDITNYTTA